MVGQWRERYIPLSSGNGRSLRSKRKEKISIPGRSRGGNGEETGIVLGKIESASVGRYGGLGRFLVSRKVASYRSNLADIGLV